MMTSGNTVLITGGATGIGFAIAEAFSKSGNNVIICGRRAERLEEAKRKLPNIHTIVCDVSKAEERKRLHEWATRKFPDLNVIVNNAGIQRQIDFRRGASVLESGENEIEVNLVAPIELSAYFIPHLAEKNEAAIINISSGLGFVPLAMVPVYCATKAAIHSFSMSLRHQLKDTPIRVFEIIPPIVKTELGMEARKGRKIDYGLEPAAVAESVIKSLGENEFEVAVGDAENLRMGSRKNPEQVFGNMNR